MRTFIEAFQLFLSGAGLPYPVAGDRDMESLLSTFFDDRTRFKTFQAHVGTKGYRYTGDVYYVRCEVAIDVRKNLGTQGLEPFYNSWVAFVDEMNSIAPTGASMRMVSSSWTRLLAETRVINSTIWAFVLSTSLTLVIVLISTGNVVLALYTTITIVLTTGTLFGFLVYVLGWKFGAIQAIGLIFFVGLSVDYCLHLSHSYNMSIARSREDKVKKALLHLGTAIVGGAVTTAGSVIFLWPCWIVLFVQLGVMIFANMTLAVFYTFLFLCPVLMMFGPLGACGNIYACCQPRASNRGVLQQVVPTSVRATDDAQPPVPLYGI
jgi:predicted RND superfamily exporter protein